MLSSVRNSLAVVEPKDWAINPKCDYKYHDISISGSAPRVDKCCLLSKCSFIVDSNITLVIAPFTCVGAGTNITIKLDGEDGISSVPQQVIIGDHVTIGQNCTIKSPIGPNTWIEDDVTIEDGVDIKGCVLITKGSRVVKGSVLSRFSSYSGNPAEKEGSLDASYVDIVRLACEREYGMSVSAREKDFLPFVSDDE